MTKPTLCNTDRERQRQSNKEMVGWAGGGGGGGGGAGEDGKERRRLRYLLSQVLQYNATNPLRGTDRQSSASTIRPADAQTDM